MDQQQSCATLSGHWHMNKTDDKSIFLLLLGEHHWHEWPCNLSEKQKGFKGRAILQWDHSKCIRDIKKTKNGKIFKHINVYCQDRDKWEKMMKVKMIWIRSSMIYNWCFFCLTTTLAATHSDLWSKANELIICKRR